MKLTYRFAAVCVLTLGPFGLGGQAVAAPHDAGGPVSTFCNNPVNLSLVASPGGSGLLGEVLGSLGLGGAGGESGAGGSGTSTPSEDGTATGGEGGTATTSSDQEANNNRCGKSVDIDQSRSGDDQSASSTQQVTDSIRRG
ncbi:hypothetical protein [Streptomyces sp. NPDC093544]|jgi:hypothetical protein|uniref:hypothetical protein n=1 Tax=Streptomyces sp. NPDC093544 TaxID=3155200 RepID=UPI003448CA12